MLNIRFREKTNTWPGFVDLFSNLVIILIFLLIVFVFLWTTTSVFNKTSGVKTIAELKKANEQQSVQLSQMMSDEAEAKRLLILARGELENLQNNNSDLQNQLGALDNELKDKDMSIQELVSAYEDKVNELRKSGTDMQNMISELTRQLEITQKSDKQKTAELEQQRAQLQSDLDAQTQALTNELQNLEAALNAAEEKSRNQEIQYVDMSDRLNRALTDKVSELNKKVEELNRVGQYQSDFYKAIKIALGNRTTVKQDGDRFVISSDILFGSGEYKLSPEGKNQLRLIGNVIKDFEDKIPSDVNWIIRVDGHTDKKPVVSGNHAYKDNIQLSLLRSTAVVSELEKAGVSKRRLVPSGFGEMYPTELGTDPASLQKNRRIELRLTNR